MIQKSIPIRLISIAAFCLLLAACSASGQVPESESFETPTSTSNHDDLDTEPTDQASPTSPTPNETPTHSGISLTESEASQLMYDLAFGPGSQAALETILSKQDRRFVAVLIELLRINQIGLPAGVSYAAHIDALETLSGQTFGDDWPSWVEWYGTTQLVPPAGFTGWKGKLLGRIDPGFEQFLQDDLPSVIRVEEIMWGGVLVDGIPALDNPKMIPAEEALYLDPDEPVFGISINGDHRSYPLRIMDWHEMANDVVGGVPVSLAYCTLCGAGIAYDTRTSEVESFTFGSSGFLFRSNKLMYDRQTRTLWNQLTGEPVLGELVNMDIKLDLLPVVVTSWQAWLSQHPDTLVLDVDTGYQRPYFPGQAYGAYFADDETMFPVWQRSDLMDTKARIFALQVEAIPKAYPLELLFEQQVVNDTIGTTNVVLIASRGEINVQRDEVISYNAGGEVRSYLRSQESFTPGPDPDSVIDSAGRFWLVTEEALVGPEGELAPRLNGHLAYWFGWYSFFPNTLLYQRGG